MLVSLAPAEAARLKAAAQFYGVPVAQFVREHVLSGVEAMEDAQNAYPQARSFDEVPE